jgi:hypothetical protein
MTPEEQRALAQQLAGWSRRGRADGAAATARDPQSLAQGDAAGGAALTGSASR